MSTFSQKLRELRLDKNLSMRQLANVIGATDAAVSNWENDLNEPKLSYIVKLSLCFDVSTDYLLGLEDDVGNKNNSSGFTINKLN